MIYANPKNLTYFLFFSDEKEGGVNRKKRRPYAKVVKKNHKKKHRHAEILIYSFFQLLRQTKSQIQQLEQEYRMNTYIARERRLDLGRQLNLTDRQVKVGMTAKVVT